MVYYKLLAGSDISELEQKVNDLMINNMSWVPIGGVAIAELKGGIALVQAMILKPDIDIRTHDDIKLGVVGIEEED